MDKRQAYREILDNAIKAVHDRTFYEQYKEHPKAYGAEAGEKGAADYANQLNNPFNGLQQGESTNWIGEEVSPYTQEALGVTYPTYSANEMVEKASAVKKAWGKVDAETRAFILIDSLEKVKEQFFQIGHATMHTTGQSFMMSFQASGPHAADRALESIALGYQELTRFPANITWTKPMGKFDIVLDKSYKAVGKGVGLVIGCSTFPTWNTVPGVYASLMTGNPTIIKPHPKAVLPIALVVEAIQASLVEHDLDPTIVQLAVDGGDKLITKELAEHKEVTLIDYTGGSAFGDYIESIPNKTVFTEKAGVNSVILDSCADLKTVFQNLSFSLALYSGQMCTAPQNFFIPEGGVKNGDEVVPYETVVEMLAKSISGLVNHPKMGAGTLGAIQNPTTLERAQNIEKLGAKVVLAPSTVENPEFTNARICTPTLIEVSADDNQIFEQELFGPIAIVIKTKDTEHSIALAKEMAKNHGAITCAAYTTDANTEERIYEEMESVFTPVSMNLTGFIWVNQHAAFSDFHVTGGNPAGNASFTNPEYLTKRFVWVGHRKVNS